jgi:hypothetical protein
MCAGAMHAQTQMQTTSIADETYALEAYGGFNYARVNINSTVSGFSPSAQFNGYGGGGQLEYNVTSRFGIVGDGMGFYVPNGSDSGGAFSYTAGPRWNFRHEKYTPFAEVLAGGILASSGIGQLGPESAFALLAGGGLDITLNEHVAFRPIEADYFMTKLSDGENNRQNNFRVGTGVSLRFGGLK